MNKLNVSKMPLSTGAQYESNTKYLALDTQTQIVSSIEKCHKDAGKTSGVDDVQPC